MQEYISNGDDKFNGDYFKTLYLKREMLDELLLMYFSAVNEENKNLSLKI